MSIIRTVFAAGLAVLVLTMNACAQVNLTAVSSLQELAQVAGTNNQNVKMAPGLYRMAEYLIDPVLAQIKKDVTGTGRRPVWMLRFTGDNNRFDFSGVTFEIDTSLYRKLPGGYMRCVFITGKNNRFDGLTIRFTGENIGSNGNTLSVWGERNVVENVTLNVYGSFPYGYGDLLGKGGPNIVKPLLKQSGLMVGGEGNTVRRCKVFSRAFGHCFYVQNAKNTRIEDCYAEGVMRSTNDILRETSGPAFDLGFRSIYENRDGRYLISPGYTKSLCEDGFRTYGGVSQTTILNCTAVNTRAGFEIGGTPEDKDKTVVENCIAKACERGYLLGSNVVVRNGRGDCTYGPLLYLRPGTNSDVELELTGGAGNSTVHDIATIAGTNNRVKLTASSLKDFVSLPIMLGFDMPKHAEMSSPILPVETANVNLVNEIPNVPVITSDLAKDCIVTTAGKTILDAESKKAP